MFNEAGVLLDLNEEPIHWHVPPGRSAVQIPDTRELWDLIWEHRDNISGFAHTHPGSGPPWPSSEDVTTFSAIERALGARLKWWIASETDVVEVQWRGPDLYDYRVSLYVSTLSVKWFHPLRERSSPNNQPGEQS